VILGHLEMDIKDFGKKAGLAGLALGVLFYLFRDFLQQIPGLPAPQAFAIMRSFLILVFGISGIGVLTWLVVPQPGNHKPIPTTSIVILALLFVVVVLAAVFVGTSPVNEKDLPKSTQIVIAPINICAGNGGGASCLGPSVVAYTCAEYRAIGGGADATYKAFNDRFCQGKGDPKKNVRHNFSREGGECGWTSFTVTCLP
jgi:hypothetical protein